MFCVSCGKRLEAGMRYCPACGAVVEGAAGGWQATADSGARVTAAGGTQASASDGGPATAEGGGQATAAGGAQRTSAGGAQAAGSGVPPPPPPAGGVFGGAARAVRTPVLLRPREGRVIAGVCAAFAQRYGWDVMVVRIVLGVVTLLSAVAVGVAVYLVAWIVIPEAPYALPDASR